MVQIQFDFLQNTPELLGSYCCFAVYSVNTSSVRWKQKSQMGLKSFGSQSCWDRIGTKSIISSSIGTKNAHQSNAGSKSYSDPDVVVCFQSDFSIKFGKKKHECYTMGEEWLSLFSMWFVLTQSKFARRTRLNPMNSWIFIVEKHGLKTMRVSNIWLRHLNKYIYIYVYI